jgi:N-acetyl-anhydromuramyl-L-alanine amidase AmpD
MPMTPADGFPYDGSMLTVGRFWTHNGWIELGHGAAAGRGGRTGLIAGHKKDVVVTNRTAKQPGRVPIYGWQQLNGKAIQPLSLIHEAFWYADYAHGTRLVAPIIRIDDVDVSLEEVMMDPERCGLVVDVSAAVDGGPLTLQTTRLALTTPAPYVKPTPATGTPIPAPSSPPPPVVVRGTGDWPGIKFQQAEQYKAIPAGRKVDLVVLHTGELPEQPTGAEAVANYFSRPRDKNGNVVTASSHFVHDNDSTVQCVLEKDIAYAAPGANHNGLQIEHAGYARQTAADWADDYSTRELQISAQLTAKLCVKYAIPPNFVDDIGLLAGARGITTHVAVSKAFKRSTHTDPGPNFPMEHYLELVRQSMETA